MQRLDAQDRQEATTGEQARGARTAGAVHMFTKHAAQPNILCSGNLLGGHEVALQHIFGFGAENVGQAPGHSRPEIETDRSEDQSNTAGHVFAAMLANAFDYGKRATVADGKALARSPSDEQSA